MVGRIIDFETNGNVVKFYLGGGEYYTGDDWDDKPYENNAGKVYDKYIKGTRVMYFDIDDLILEPREMVEKYSKDDMKERKVPCIIRVSKELLQKQTESHDFEYWNKFHGTSEENECIEKFYFGDLLLDGTFVDTDSFAVRLEDLLQLSSAYALNNKMKNKGAEDDEETENKPYKVKEFRKIVKEMANLYEQKNSNNGNSFSKLYQELGAISGLVPLHNKLTRLTTLIKCGPEKNKFESIEDTLKDLACYAVMNLIEMDRITKDKTTDEDFEKIWFESFEED